MGLLSRVKNRLLPGKPTARLGAAFTRAHAEEWADLVEQVDNYTQKTGAAIVQSWEVGAAELARAIRGRADEKALIERYSDALVPTLSPFQDLHKQTSSVMAAGLAAGQTAGQTTAATAALNPLVAGLGARAAAGWVKTVDYLEPVLAASADPAATRAALLAHGPRLSAGCDAAGAVLAAELARAPERATLWAAVTDPFDAWQARLVRELEITLTDATRTLVRDARP